MEKEKLSDNNFFSCINYIDEVKIFNEIQNNKKVIIFDFRRREEFHSCHLELSVNIPFDEYDYKFFELNSKSELERLKDYNLLYPDIKARLKNPHRYYVVILISNERIKRERIENYKNEEIDSKVGEKIFKVLTFYKSLLKMKVRELGLYNLGYDRIILNYQFLCHFTDIQQPVSNISAFPSDILDRKIYIGNQCHAHCEEVKKHLKITHILNITQHVKNKFKNDETIKYENIEIEDTPNFKISKYFKKAYDFIEEALSNNSNPSRGISTSDLYENLHTNDLVNETVDSELNQFIDDLIDMEVIIDKDFSKLQNFGINYLENWKEAFNSTKNLNLKNKIIKLVFKNLFNKSSSNNKILIHCSQGVSRSPTIAIMYIMKKFLLSFKDAFDLVYLHREKTQPIDSFLEELKEFEKNGFKFEEEL